ncbi:GH1 family beta-glucosidase [Ferviditalea candida]|uniref:Beta-glucosidase n=1 Tax=Ferviditalea candida TaxID=3108399 RepID=A0ABU5ZJU0_9BACL|nr:GH1 family beta-glucosidase [Paenibacillaceae bacterium T2]
MDRIQFPKNFVWGTATAAYQIEGAYDEDGRGMSIWDTFAHTPGKTYNGHTGDVACDSYHRLDEDIALLKELGVRAYRFSIAWPRILPEGRGDVNEKGLEYYHKLVNRLLVNDIEPYCTLYHWDLPQKLQELGGWNSRETVDAFVEYAEAVFGSLGNKIGKWFTINEPWCVSFLSHYLGEHAPGLRDFQLALNVSHHVLLAHGRVVKRFRERGLAGEIGIVPNVEWFEPYSAKEQDVEACARRNGHFNQWFLDPVLKGRYPGYMLQWYEKLGYTVPIQQGDMDEISQPIDFLGINYYSGGVGKHAEQANLLKFEPVDTGFSKTDIYWNIFPEGFYRVLSWIDREYGKIPIYITENGACFYGEFDGERNRDAQRIDYLKKHMIQLHRSIESGVNIRGYFVWSLMDNFEWAYGYSKPFGLVHVDFDTLNRTKKDSYYWYKKFIRQGWLQV